jgi:hypothetical protein
MHAPVPTPNWLSAVTGVIQEELRENPEIDNGIAAQPRRDPAFQAILD